MPKSYVPDLKAFMSQCEINFALLDRLLFSQEKTSQWQWQLPNGQQVRIKKLESSPYTTTVKFILSGFMGKTENSDITDNVESVGRYEFLVRVYHDAKLAEVMAENPISAMPVKMVYPNKKMHQKNEKQSVNEFLGECLAHCAEHAGVSEWEIYNQAKEC